MDQYAELIGDNASPEDYNKIASHFDNIGDHLKAGKFFFLSKDYDKVIIFNLICLLFDMTILGFTAFSSMSHFTSR